MFVSALAFTPCAYGTRAACRRIRRGCACVARESVVDRTREGEPRVLPKKIAVIRDTLKKHLEKGTGFMHCYIPIYREFINWDFTFEITIFVCFFHIHSRKYFPNSLLKQTGVRKSLFEDNTI